MDLLRNMFPDNIVQAMTSSVSRQTTKEPVERFLFFDRPQNNEYIREKTPLQSISCARNVTFYNGSAYTPAEYAELRAKNPGALSVHANAKRQFTITHRALFSLDFTAKMRHFISSGLFINPTPVYYDELYQKDKSGMNILGLVVFSLVFGYFITILGEQGATMAAFMKSLEAIIMKMVELVIW